MFKVLLISLHDTGTYGHRCVSSSLRQNGIHVSNLFFRSNRLYQDATPVSDVELQALSDLAKNLKPDLIGINVHSSFGHPLLERVVVNVKSRLDVPLVLGGVHPTLLPAFCLERTMADYVCVGEGEESAVELCRSIESCTEVSVPGIMTRKMLDFDERKPPQDLAQLPFQDVGNDDKYSVTSEGKILEGDPLLRERIYPTKASRGCPFQCSYCSVAQLRSLCGSSAFYRLRPVESIIQEILAFLELNSACTDVRFWDDTFPFKSTWIEEFSALYKEKVGKPFRIWLNPDTTKESNIAMLRSAGLQSATVGIESASEETRRKVFLRCETTEEILQADTVLSEHSVIKTYDFILDHPWQCPDEWEGTFDLITKLKRPFLLNMHGLILLPGTELALRAIREGVSCEDDILAGITADTRSSSRRIQWIRGVPSQEDSWRAYWLFMIFSAASTFVPVALVRAVAYSAVFQRYPGIFGDSERNLDWLVRDSLPLGLSKAYRRFEWLQRFLRKRPGVRRIAKSLILSHYVAAAYWVLYVSYRVVTRMPSQILSHGKA